MTQRREVLIVDPMVLNDLVKAVQGVAEKHGISPFFMIQYLTYLSKLMCDFIGIENVNQEVVEYPKKANENVN